MELTSYLLGKKAGGGGGSGEETKFIISSGTNSLPGFTHGIERLDNIYLEGNSMAYAFRDYKGTTLPKIKSSEKITTLQGAFFNCSNLIKLDLTNLNFSEVTNVANAFSTCSRISVLDISNLEMSKLSNQKTANVFNAFGLYAKVENGAYGSGLPYIYVKNATEQSWVINNSPTTWTTDNVIVKGQ